MANRGGEGESAFTLRRTFGRDPKDSPDPHSIFRAENVLNARDLGGGVVIPEPSTDAYSPYAVKWKEFDRLQKQVKGGKIRWLDWIWSVILPAIGLFEPHHVQRKDRSWLFGAGVAIAVAALLRAQYAKYLFAHWPCPRCGAEWPGTKTEKDPRCPVCGLKLHQLAP